MTSSMPPTAQRTLGLFAKAPMPGQVKSRLALQSSAAWAAAVAEAFLRDSVMRLSDVQAQRYLVFTPADAREFFTELAAGKFHVEQQAAGDLGQRLRAFMSAHLNGEQDRVVVVGADSPTLPLAYVDDAFQALDQADVVLGPATDGGYYLLGCRSRVPPIFEQITWGGPNVLSQTIAHLADDAGRLALLPPWYDVDTMEDWQALQGHVAAMRRAGLTLGIPCTERLMR